MKKMLLAGVCALSPLILVLSNFNSKPFVSGHEAYAHYMPEGYGVKSWSCTVDVPAFGDYTYYVRDAYMRCSLQYAAKRNCPAWMPHQWCPANVRMLAEAPR